MRLKLRPTRPVTMHRDRRRARFSRPPVWAVCKSSQGSILAALRIFNQGTNAKFSLTGPASMARTRPEPAN